MNCSICEHEVHDGVMCGNVNAVSENATVTCGCYGVMPEEEPVKATEDVVLPSTKRTAKDSKK